MFTENHPHRLVLDLSELIYLDSTGLSVFVATHKRAQACGMEFGLANPNSSVRQLLQITALDQIFNIAGSSGLSDLTELAVDRSESVGPAD
jgi:anti-sigma B factor antagonist